MKKRQIIARYFAAEDAGDVECIVELCSQEVTVRNAAQPVQRGKEGVRDYVTAFVQRTSSRSFEVLAIAEEGDLAFAWWNGRLTFKAGVPFGPTITTKQPFDITLEGVIRFRFNGDDEIEELDVYHETTSVFLAAAKAAAD